MSLSRTEPHQGEADGVLEHFLSQAIVDEYEHVEPDALASSRRVRSWTAAGAAALIGLLVAASVVNTRVSDAERQETRSALVDRVAAVTASVDQGQARVDEQSVAVEALRTTLLADSATASEAARLDELAVAAGAREATAPGIVVSIDDAPDAEAGSLNRVLDRDVQDIVNTLWRLGATGIAINEQRLTIGTAIRGAGEAILVNYQPQNRPYRIAATGVASVDAGLADLLAGLTSDYGLVTDASLGDVALPAGEVRTPRFAMTRDGGATP